MIKRLRIRFSLARFLLLVTAVVLLVGYSQTRRRSIRRKADGLARAGVTVAHRPQGAFTTPAGIPSQWHDRLWQRRPNEASIYVLELNANKFRVGDAAVNRAQLLDHLLSLEQRARDLGAETVAFCADGKPPYAPSDWVFELDLKTEARILACKLGNSTYDAIPGIADPLADP
jgi:hypothetical protein